MTQSIYVLGEALMDCLAQADGSLRPFIGGSPYNLARAAALHGAEVVFINPFSTDAFGQQMVAQLAQDAVRPLQAPSALPTSLAVVQIKDGQPSYGFYREGIADRDYTPEQVLEQLSAMQPGVFHTGSLLLVPPEHHKVIAVIQGLKQRGWTISVDANLRPKLAANLAEYVAAVHSVLKLADWIKASDEDLELLGFAHPTRATAPHIAAQLAQHGARRIALTFGGQGAWMQVDGNSAERDVPVVQIADTVGAGDTFWGNCLADWAITSDGAAQRVEKTLHYAMQAAAINCTRQGCQPPRHTEVQQALR
jgi:fructokinase